MSLQDEKKALIKRLIDLGYLRTPEVIKAFRKIKRESFVPQEYKKHAYVDEPLPIGFGQTISQPLTVATMTEALDLHKSQKVLEIGTGSGYQAAVIAELVGKKGIVVTVERLKELYDFAKNNLQKEGCKNVKTILSDGSLGYEKEAPYDRIIVTAEAPEIPQSLFRQMNEGGKMVIPVGHEMFIIEKKRGKAERQSLGYYVFVPLVGEEGYNRKA
ncbi:MAG: protein-L-isoaspartate(D-aspartate) O-methyltransferase [Candidatus Aenigmarchaeota archaeon]|nr:protein-L-isoaspartate(D-aspartate) O-methyltransferase [Candidatus Aenigmarchaeota archaeon]